MIIFLVAVWPGRLYGVDFFEKSLEHGYSNLVEIDKKISEIDSIQLFWATIRSIFSGKPGFF